MLGHWIGMCSSGSGEHMPKPKPVGPYNEVLASAYHFRMMCTYTY